MGREKDKNPEKFLAGQTAVVTGASRGIGRAIALELAACGANIAFNFQRSDAEAGVLAAELKKQGVEARGSKVDIRSFDEVRNWIEEVKNIFGRLDILVNNAGITRDKALMMMAPEDCQEVMATNLTGAFNAARACIITLMKQKSGVIINIASVSGLMGLAGQTNYSSSKGGLIAFTKALAKEVAPFGVRVNCVAPGYIDTDMTARFKEEQKARILAQIPLGRMVRAEEVAQAVGFLAGPGGRYITGQVLVVDGGLFMR